MSIKKVFSFFAFSFLIINVAKAQHDHTMPPMRDSVKTGEVQHSRAVYQCPMKCEGAKTYNNPGKCPVCGMELKKLNMPEQHQMQMYQCPMHPEEKSSRPAKCPKCGMDMEKIGSDMDGGSMHGESHENMSHAFSLNLPMNRNGSGTGWLPDAAPMFGTMYHTKNWMYMLHGNLFLRYNNQDFSNKGSLGDKKFDAPNWVMFMGQRKAGQSGLFHFSSMLSLDPVTVGGEGYPLLFQSGETYNGEPLVDRQHPHDLFSELSVSYSHALSKSADIFAYVGYPGEPALGPVAFMHRPSALANPDAPLSHHWVDATHITFGVATLGVRLGKLKIEGSSFTGREPDENRYDFDRPRFDSWSSRLSFNPSQNWALQASHAFVKSPETTHPDKDINRTTASAVYSLPLMDDGSFDAALVWGMNKVKDHDGEHALLAEGSWRKQKLTLHSRYEFVQKSAEELHLDEAMFGHDEVFPVNAFTLGFNYDVLKIGKANVAGGGQFSLYHADKKLDALYGKNPMAFEVYLRLYPGLMKMDH